ncbi:MAG: ABC transporter permease [Desulfovibrionaceae bacterium]|nr:ABC transporter permease [Desulfovibrionaceae bacterium]MDD4951993.1 ABC transporter permease [Desulfovibrionaceae bacterium]
MIRGWRAVYYRETLILRRRLRRLSVSMAVSPLLYIVAFGYAMGPEPRFDGRTYLEFLIPGLAAMASMTQAWAVASEINISRFYHKVFEEIQAAPVSPAGYALGEVLAGVTRAFLGVAMILGLGFLFGVRGCWGPLFWLGVFLNSFVFACLAVAMAMVVKSHADQSMLTSLVITPMAFLGGTFFPVDRLPDWARTAVSVLPLTPASKAIRAAAFGRAPDPGLFLLLGLLGLILFGLAVYCVRLARD